MTLQDSAVGDAIAEIFQANKPAAGTPITPENLKSIWEQVMAKIYGEAGGVRGATVTVEVASVSGVTSGGSTSGPGTGTATIT